MVFIPPDSRNCKKMKTMTTNIRVSLAFAKLSDADLAAFTQNIIDSLTGNASYPTPAVTVPDLTAGLTKFTDALAAAAQGGLQLTALKNVAREDLLALLRTEASYVQLTASDDLPKMLSSGYSNISTTRTKIPLPKPDIAAIDNENSTELVVRITPVTNARAYEVQQRTGTGNWQTAGIYTQARRIVLENLAPGTTYTVQARAVGGTTGYSDWSDPVSHMAM